MEFVASEDEVELDSINVSDVKVHTFFVKEHIDVHMPPKNLRTKTEGMNFSEIRPILRFPSNSPRSCTGSQTDISALNLNSELHYKGKYFYLLSRREILLGCQMLFIGFFYFVPPGENRTSSAEPCDEYVFQDESSSNDRHWVSEPSLVAKYNMSSKVSWK